MSPRGLVACLRSANPAGRPAAAPEGLRQHIGTKDLSRAAHHVRRAEQAGLMRKIGWVGGWVAMTPEVSVSLFRRAASGYDPSCQVMTLVALPHNPGRGLENWRLSGYGLRRRPIGDGGSEFAPVGLLGGCCRPPPECGSTALKTPFLTAFRRFEYRDGSLGVVGCGKCPSGGTRSAVAENQRFLDSVFGVCRAVDWRRDCPRASILDGESAHRLEGREPLG